MSAFLNGKMLPRLWFRRTYNVFCATVSLATSVSRYLWTRHHSSSRV